MNNTNQDTTANRTFKATLFHKLFGESKTYALSLYNAVNGSSYTNEDDLEFTTLEDVIYMKMKDDVSFLLGTSLSLYEHQSTYNPNMPLRGFLYFASLYRKLIKGNEQIYSKNLVRIPNPKYIVFYNGSSSAVNADYEKLKLSDCFEEPDTSGEFEWTATMLNINVGYNREIFQKCRILEEYSIFIQRVREYNKSTKNLTRAVNLAVEDCIRDDILKDILEKQKKEVVDVVLTEFDEEKFEAMIREESREEGLQTGKLQTICELVSEGELSLEKALIRTGMTEQAFKELTIRFGIAWNKN